MSMHVCVSGVTSYQRAILKSKKTSESDENWLMFSSLNSLSEVSCYQFFFLLYYTIYFNVYIFQVYKLYCGKEISKDPRNSFVEGTLKEIKEDFQNLISYCAGDVLATLSVLKSLYPMFKERFPHPVTLAGMLELSTAYLPVNSNWLEYINSADLTYEDVELESKFMLAKKADKACELFHSEAYNKDLWMWDQDWSVQNLKLKKPILKKLKWKESPKNESEIIPTKSTETKESKNNDSMIGYFDHDGNFLPSNDDEEEDEILSKKFAHLFNMSQLLPVRKQLLPGYPAWYRKLCKKPNEPNWIPGAHEISTGMQVCFFLYTF